MHWIIQSNLVAGEDVDRLRQALDRLATPYTMVKLIPIVRTLETVPKIKGPAFVYGSTYIHRSAYDQGWWPGYVGGRHSYEEVLAHYGDQMLNADIERVPLSRLCISETMFVRPDDDGKLFTGMLLDAPGLTQLREQLRGQGHDEATLGAMVVVSSPKKILAEHRCFVVDGKVVCASTYRRGGRVLYDGRVDQHVLDYAQDQADKWCPEIGFALDVAETPLGLRVVEINALSSSGLYSCDLLRLVDAVNGLDGLMPKPQRTLGM